MNLRACTAIFSAFLFIFITSAGAQVKKEDINAAINITALKHPYLLFSDKDKPAILDRIKNDTECAGIMSRLVNSADRLMSAQVDTMLRIEPRHPRAVPAPVNEQIRHFNSLKSSAFTLAFVYQMTGDPKYARKSFEFADALCDYPLWAYRAHEFPIIYSRVWPWGVGDDQVAFSYDIRSGHTAIDMALIYDWCYTGLDKRQRDRIRGALLEKAILVTRGNYDYHWWANAYRCNWLGICFSGIGTASIALLTENPELTDVIAESYNRMYKMFDEIGVDGDWQEGRSYWAYGFAACMPFMESLRRVTEGEYDFFKHRSWRENPADFALFGLTGNFGDGSGRVVGNTYMFNKLIELTKNPTAAWYRENYLGPGTGLYDIIWPRTNDKGVKPAVASKHFRSIDWVFMRTDFQMPETVEIAAKAGFNDDPHHGHLDCGNMILTWLGESFLADHGGATYDEQYFDEARWEYPHASSIGHNVVFVNKELQSCAKYKDKPWKTGIGGKILEFRTNSKRDYTLIDPSGAYPGKELKKWRRHIILDKPVVTVLLDEILSNKGAEIEVRFHSACSAQNKEDHVLLQGKNGSMALIPVSEPKAFIRSGTHPVVPKRDAEGIPYFGNVVTASSGKTDIITIIAPVNDDKEAKSIMGTIKKKSSSSGLTLSFNYRGNNFNYSFKNSKEGLILEK